METSQFKHRDYRGATIEDLDIKPAISINPTTSISAALDLSFENEFTYLPVIHEVNKKLLGVLNVEHLRNNPDLITKYEPIVKTFMFWFSNNVRKRYAAEHEQSKKINTTPINAKIITPYGTGSKDYTVLTPYTPLEDLAKFFNSGNYFAIITENDGKFVYGVATPDDLIKYEKARPKL